MNRQLRMEDENLIWDNIENRFSAIKTSMHSNLKGEVDDKPKNILTTENKEDEFLLRRFVSCETGKKKN